MRDARRLAGGISSAVCAGAGGAPRGLFGAERGLFGVLVDDAVFKPARQSLSAERSIKRPNFKEPGPKSLLFPEEDDFGGVTAFDFEDVGFDFESGAAGP